ncbi:MAG: DNA primase, partial [Acidobacteria bacterium]|nr:DNA primase [Acidobacteriota bacterium]
MPLGNVSLTPQLVQAVRDAVDIVAIASEHTRLRKAGRHYQGLCPLHKEKTPSFSVDPVKGLFYCFGCGAGGDAIKLHMLTTNDDFPSAIEALAQRYGIPLPSRAVRAGGQPERDIEGALASAAGFFAEQLRRSAAAQRYLAGRRVPPELVERFGLGYAPDSWQALTDSLRGRVAVADLEAAGLVGRSERDRDRLYDRFRHRLMFPIHNPSGRLVGFGGRALGDDKAKYVNTVETERFHKGHLLYGLYQARQEIREERRAVLVEGYFDVIATVASGRPGAVAGMGTALTQEQAKLLARYADEVVVAYDGDRAGEAAFERALPILLAEGLGVLRASFGEGHDPDSLRLASGEAAVAAAIDGAEDGVVLQLRRAIPAPMASAKLKATHAAALAALLEPIRDPLMRHEYARRAAEMLGVPEKEFSSRLKELKGWRGVAERPASETGGPPGGAAAAGAAGSHPRLVRSLEEQVLAKLL